MKHYLLPAWLTIMLLALLPLSSCSDDIPAETSEEDILGIWTDKADHFLYMGDTEHMDEYTKTEFQDTPYWLKRHTVYFYEPNSQLVMLEDMEGTLHVYKVISISDTQLVLCWVATPDIADLESDTKLEIFRVFFDRDYTVDPARYQTFRRMTRQEFTDALGDTEVLDS